MLGRQNPQPLHRQFEAVIRQKIESQEWEVNSCIPSENELSRIYGISRMTVRSVLNRLVDADLLYRVPGKGTFVAAPKIVSRPPSQMGLREQLEKMGYSTSTRLIHIRQVAASAQVARELMLPEGEPVYEVLRLRRVGDEPLSLHVSYLPVSLCPQLEEQDLEGQQLCDILEQNYRFTIDRVVETLEITKASAEEAQLLAVRPGVPLLFLEQIVYDQQERRIEYAKILLLSHKIKLRMEYSRPC